MKIHITDKQRGNYLEGDTCKKSSKGLSDSPEENTQSNVEMDKIKGSNLQQFKAKQ